MKIYRIHMIRVRIPLVVSTMVTMILGICASGCVTPSKDSAKDLAKDPAGEPIVLLTSGKGKATTAPSGDPRDYFSLSPYMWPDPAQPDGRPYVYRDGEMNPERLKFDQPKLQKMIKSVARLARAFEKTGNVRYAERINEWLKGWFSSPETRMNPHFNFAQHRPGTNKLSPSGIIEARDLAYLIDVVVAHNQALLVRKGNADFNEVFGRSQAVQTAFQIWLKNMQAWLTTSEIGLKEERTLNNHGTWFDYLVLKIAGYLGDQATVDSILSNFGKKRLDAQIAVNGMQPQELKRTKAFNYSVFNLQAAFLVAAAAEGSRFDLWNYGSGKDINDGDRAGNKRRPLLQTALDWLIPYGNCQKKFPYRQIEKTNMKDFYELIQSAARLVDRGIWENSPIEYRSVGEEQLRLCPLI